MKRFLIKIVVFFALIVVIDFLVGNAFRYLQTNVAEGRTGSEYHVCNGFCEDVLVMGSSRALHHYVPQIIADSLGLTCYNGGQDGNGIIMQYGRWKMISRHHLPKIIIYDVEPAFDLSINDNFRYMDRLKPFADDKDVRSFICAHFPLERIKLLSRMYRNNYKFLEILSDCIRPSVTENGYKPLMGHIRQEVIDAESDSKSLPLGEMDEVKLDCLLDLMTEARSLGVQVVLVSSPYWKGLPTVDLGPVRELAENRGIPFIDFSKSSISENPDWFADSMHLNNDGARRFTLEVVKALRLLCVS